MMVYRSSECMFGAQHAHMRSGFAADAASEEHPARDTNRVMVNDRVARFSKAKREGSTQC